MKQFALILTLALIFTAAQVARAIPTCTDKDEECGNTGVTSADSQYKCCARMKGTYLGQELDGHYCMQLTLMKTLQASGSLDKAYCDGASYISAAFATLFVSIFTLSF